MSHTYEYPRPTVDVVVFGLDMTSPPTVCATRANGSPFNGTRPEDRAASMTQPTRCGRKDYP